MTLTTLSKQNLSRMDATAAVILAAAEAAVTTTVRAGVAPVPVAVAGPEAATVREARVLTLAAAIAGRVKVAE